MKTSMKGIINYDQAYAVDEMWGVMNEEHEATMIPDKDKDDTKGIVKEKRRKMSPKSYNA